MAKSPWFCLAYHHALGGFKQRKNSAIPEHISSCSFFHFSAISDRVGFKARSVMEIRQALAPQMTKPQRHRASNQPARNWSHTIGLVTKSDSINTSAKVVTLSLFSGAVTFKVWIMQICADVYRFRMSWAECYSKQTFQFLTKLSTRRYGISATLAGTGVRMSPPPWPQQPCQEAKDGTAVLKAHLDFYQKRWRLLLKSLLSSLEVILCSHMNAVNTYVLWHNKWQSTALENM